MKSNILVKCWGQLQYQDFIYHLREDFLDKIKVLIGRGTVGLRYQHLTLETHV